MLGVVFVSATLLVFGSGCDLGFGRNVEPDIEPEDEASLPAVGEEVEDGLTLLFPTRNDALLRANPAAFYQGLDATIPGIRPFQWMGGQYGFVRNQARTPVGTVFTRVHHGIDIRPLERDGAGVPLDTVRAIADGRVVYVNSAPGGSAFGIYVVVEHDWDDSPVYSLLAHLASAWVRPGDQLAAGAPVGRMGYTGTGLARHRAHVHLEIALKLSQHYNAWHGRFFGSRNPHGVYMGRNLIGVNPSELYVGLTADPALTFQDFVRSRTVGYRVALPGSYGLDLLERYPWLADDGVSYADRDPNTAWDVRFTREGVPIGVGRVAQSITTPQILYVSDEIRRGYLSTNGYLLRGSDGYRLSRAGMGHMALLVADRRGVPNWF